MKESSIRKRTVMIGGQKTGVTLEDEFWKGMREISRARGMTLSELVAEIDAAREQNNLSSAVRLFVLDYYRGRAVGPTGKVPPHEVRDSQCII
jgi:predicted DNA-binding ribbon-helix-helix protein